MKMKIRKYKIFTVFYFIVVVSCHKDVVLPDNALQQESTYPSNVMQQEVTYPVDSLQQEASDINEIIQPDDYSKAKKIGEIACVIRDRKGKATCAGTRCGSPTGKCGRKPTPCKCVEKLIFIDTVSNGMPFLEFAKTWNTDTGRIRLAKQGFHEVDTP